MASTYTIEDHVSHKSVNYKLDRFAKSMFYFIVAGSLIQIVFLWIFVGGGETALGLQISDEPMPVIEYWMYIVAGLLVFDAIGLSFVAWSMISEKELEFGRGGIVYTSSLWGYIKRRVFDFSDIEEFLIKEDSNKGNMTYRSALKRDSKIFPISPNLSQEDAQALVLTLKQYKEKNRL